MGTTFPLTPFSCTPKNLNHHEAVCCRGFSSGPCCRRAFLRSRPSLRPPRLHCLRHSRRLPPRTSPQDLLRPRCPHYRARRSPHSLHCSSCGCCPSCQGICCPASPPCDQRVHLQRGLCHSSCHSASRSG